MPSSLNLLLLLMLLLGIAWSSPRDLGRLKLDRLTGLSKGVGGMSGLGPGGLIDCAWEGEAALSP